jgi:ABC-type lipoprotein release transport system permease subunit
MIWTALGTSAGLIGAILMSHGLESFLYAVDPLDLPTFLLVPTGLLLTVFVASAIPAASAARLHPLSALRCE